MYNYRNEAAFSRAVVAHLRKQGYFVQRIETGTIARGVPDIFAISPTRVPMWLELKRVHRRVKGLDRAKIPWREGQQLWLREVTKYGMYARTLCAFDDCIAIIPHQSLWANDIILFSKCSLIPHINAL